MSRRPFARELHPGVTHAVVVPARTGLACRHTPAIDQIGEGVGAARMVARDKDKKAEPAA